MVAYRRNLASYCRLDLALLEGPPAAARNLLLLRKEPTEKAEEAPRWGRCTPSRTPYPDRLSLDSDAH